MNKEICSNWNDVLKRCEGLKEKCDGMNPRSGQTCKFYKTIAQKKLDDKRTRARLKAIGFKETTQENEQDKYSYENMKKAYEITKGETI